MDGMIDVGDKKETRRTATAEAVVLMDSATVEAVRDGTTPKGNVLETARAAALLAAKRTPEIIPHCHPIRIDSVGVSFDIGSESVTVRAVTAATDRTGVEMEALTAAAAAALTIYDMCKGIDSGMSIESIRLLEKTGGKEK